MQNLQITTIIEIKMDAETACALVKLLGDFTGSEHQKRGLTEAESKLVSLFYSALSDASPKPESI